MSNTVGDRIEEKGFYFLTSSRLRWEPAASGPGELRRLYVDPGDRIEARLVRFPAGAVTGGAPEVLGQEVYVVSGEFEVNGERLREGDFHRTVGAAVDGRTETGCILFTLRESAPWAGTGDAPDVGSVCGADTIRMLERRWTDTGPGMRYKRLMRDPAHHIEITLVQLDPGAAYPGHRYVGAEEIFILRGDCLCEGRKLGYGDYHRSVEGAVHRPAATEGGCEFILVRHGMPD
jgi:quercetin dioxygenase-like cupin family protein